MVFSTDFCVLPDVQYCTTVNTPTISENYNKLKSPMMSFDILFEKMYIDHLEGITYTLTDDAQEEYKKSVDAYAEFLNERYSLAILLLLNFLRDIT